jgi:hypothetical protein
MLSCHGNSGDREGQYRILINQHWRICFVWKGSDAYEDGDCSSYVQNNIDALSLMAETMIKAKGELRLIVYSVLRTPIVSDEKGLTNYMA